MNEYIKACRTNAHVGNKMKQEAQTAVEWAIIPYRQKGLLKPIAEPCEASILFREKTLKRDVDNIASFATKVILDALVDTGILPDDGRKYIKRLRYDFEKSTCDEIVVELKEIE